MTRLFHGLSMRHQSDVRLRRLDQILLRGSSHQYPYDPSLIRRSHFHPQMWPLTAILILLHLSGKNISPDIPGCCAEAERRAVLAFL